jgi:Gpi18-like mannosyltransferase
MQMPEAWNPRARDMMAGHFVPTSFLRHDTIFYSVCSLLLGSAVLLRWMALPFVSHDMQFFLLTWFDYIVKHGRFAALSDNFYNYTPFYIYMMAVVSHLDGVVDRVTLIKSISILFDGISAFYVYRIVLAARHHWRPALLSALLFLNLPTLILNGAVWGQSDVIYTTFLFGFAYFVIRKCPYRAVSMYGFALAMKLQAIFLAPFLVYLVSVGEIPILAMAIIPLVYALLSIPAALAGRGWIDLLTIYSGQVDSMQLLSAHAPNVYLFLQDSVGRVHFLAVTHAGILLAAAASLAFLTVTFLKRPSLSPFYIILASTLWLGLEPSLLPRMHDRYFFPADMMAFVFACLLPRAWWVAMLFQVGSALAYSQFLGSSLRNPIDMTGWDHIGALAMIAAMIGVVWLYVRLVETPEKRSTVDSLAPDGDKQVP